MLSMGSFFKDKAAERHPDAWNELWVQKTTPWDRNAPSVALSDLLARKAELFDLPTAAAPKTALVPGCGKGHDALLLASFGYDVYGLDVSTAAMDEARKNADEVKGLEVYAQRGERAGSVKWIMADFFSETWPQELGPAGGKFDLIFDYTFFCALPPTRKPEWAAKMVKLLSPGGKLVCLEFPSSKPPSTGGPPWASPPHSYLAYLGRPGQEPVWDEHGGVVEGSVEGPVKGGLRRILHEKPPRTHNVGMKLDEAGEVIEGAVDDYISVWEHN